MKYAFLFVTLTAAVFTGCSHAEFRAGENVNSAAETNAGKTKSTSTSAQADSPNANADADTTSAATPTDSAPSTESTPPEDILKTKCLNIQDGDWHIEFDGRRLLLSDTTARPKALAIDHDQRVTCEKLSLVKNARKGAALIEFTTDQKGTSTGVSDHMLGVASVQDAKWIVEPVLLSRQFDAAEKVETREYQTALWSTDKDGKAVLIVTDSATGRSEKFRP